MTVTAFRGFYIKLTPHRRVCFSTFRNPTLAYEKVDIERGTSEPSERPRDRPPENVNRAQNVVNVDKWMTNADFKCICNSVVHQGLRKEKKFMIMDTIIYLLGLGFSKDVILESSPICYYDRLRIEKGFKKIKEKEEELKGRGFNNGFTKDETHGFSNGTHLRDKRLQLCMYYMEKPSGFCFAPCKAFTKRVSHQKKKKVDELKIL